MAFTLVEIRGLYTEGGTPAKGYVTFKRSASLQDPVSNAISPNDERKVTLDANGAISINLEATDQDGIVPTGAVYTVTENIQRNGRRVYNIEVPTAGEAAGIDLADVAPVTAGPQVFTYALQSALDAETSARTTADTTLQSNIDAKPDTFLQLTDTPADYTGQAGKAVIVNATEDALEFGEAPSSVSLSDTLPLIESGAGEAGTGTAASRDDHVHPAVDLSGYATTGALSTETTNRTNADTTLQGNIDAKPDTFTDLPDTPASYPTGSARKVVRVNDAEDGLEYGGTQTLDGLDDVIIASGPVNGDTLIYNGADGEWENIPVAQAKLMWGLGTAADADTTDFDAAGAADAVAADLSTHEALTTTAHGGIVASTDPRLSDERTPTAHATTHVTGGSDVIADAVASGDSGLMSGTDKAKLDGVEAGATANQTDAYLLDRANHTGTQAASTISDFTEAAQDAVAAALVAGTNMTITYNDAANTITLDAATGGGGSLTVQEVDGTPSVTATTLIMPNGTLTDNGGGSVTYTPAAGGGGGSTDVLMVQVFS